ncbi:MAG: hypothetical protein FWF94_08725 [Oscillospiraceae bacterium]|nr:hypothetical protein [Oscillospiraceae bacterium]
MQNALLNSSTNATVKIVIENIETEKGKSVCISVDNIPGMDEIESGRSKEECAGLGITLSMKIAENYDGKLGFVKRRGVITAKLVFPLQEEDIEIPLSSVFADFYDYDNNMYNPVNIFMQEVLQNAKIRQKTCITREV